MNNLSSELIAEIKCRTSAWLDLLMDKNDPLVYKMSVSSDSSIFTSIFALFIRHLIGDTEKYTLSDKQKWIAHINSYQDEETGLYCDHSSLSERLGGTYSAEYLDHQLTCFSISALSIFGEHPKYIIATMNSYLGDSLIAWLENRDWSDPWKVGNEVMFIGIMLISNYESTGDEKFLQSVHKLIEWHNMKQDRNTGCWGVGKRLLLPDGLFGAMHQYLLYWYLNEDLNFQGTISDRTSKLIRTDGYFSPELGGGGCEDYDAVLIMVMSQKTKCQNSDISEMLNIHLKKMYDLELSTGGFLWTSRYRIKLKQVIKEILYSLLNSSTVSISLSQIKNIIVGQIRKHQPRSTGGWTITGVPYCESDLFSTWFRLLNIAMISSMHDSNTYGKEWNFLTAPGLGWFRNCS